MTRSPLWFRRLLVGGVSTLTVGGLAMTGLLSTAGTAGATSTFKITQLAGPDRFATAAAIATAAFPSGAGTIIVASGLQTNLPDSLAASYLAAQQNGGKGAPILLVNTDSVPAETAQAILTLKATSIIIVGGTSAVSASVESTLTNGGAITVSRVSGADRFATADAIDSDSGFTAVGPNKTAIIADGVDANLVDALGASPLAAAGPYPMFLVNGPTGDLSATDLSILKTDGITNAITVGGSAAIGPQIATELTTAGITSQNESGSDRSATSEALANYEISNYGFSKTEFNIAGGAQPNLVDALTGGPLGGMELAPTLITDSPTNAGSVTAFATANAATENSADLFGGSAGVSATTEAAIVAAAQSKAAVPTSLPTLVSASITGTALAGNNTGAPVGTTIQYVFSQSMTGIAINSADFHVYDSAGNRYNGTTSTVDTTNADAIDVLYTAASGTPADLTTATGASTLTLATVQSGAVTSATTGTNPDGSESIGTAGTAATKGMTTAPDLVSAAVSTATPATGATTTAVNLTFDKAAYVQSANGLFGLVLINGTGVSCVAPTSPVATGGQTSGGLLAGGDGTTTITVVCTNPAPTTTQITTADIARAIDYVNAVSTAASGGVLNPAEATSTPKAPVNSNVAPDLTGVTVTPNVNGSTTTGSIAYDFNGPVNVTSASDFLAFNSSAANVPLTPAVGSPTTDTTTVVFTASDSALASIVGASVAPNAVSSAVSGVTASNQQNEVGVSPSTTSTVTPGVVAAPQLKTVATSSFTAVGGASETGGLYTFSEPVGTPVPGNFHLYDANGTELTCTAATVQSTNTEVLCTAYNVGSTAATAAQLSGAVLGTVDYGSVMGTGNPDSTKNPEGAGSI